MRRVTVAAVVLLAAIRVAWGGVADDALVAADPATRTQVLASPEAYRALGRILERGHVVRSDLEASLKNPNVARHAVGYLMALSEVDHIPGANKVVRRLREKKADTDERARGPVFELQVAARMRDRVKALSVDLEGQEVDVLLDDDTVIEAKQLDDRPEIAEAQLESAVKQLKLRAVNGRRAMLVTSRPPPSGFSERFRETFGDEGELAEIPFTVHPPRGGAQGSGHRFGPFGQQNNRAPNQRMGSRWQPRPPSGDRAKTRPVRLPRRK